MADVLSKLFSYGSCVTLSPWKITNEAPHLGTPLPRPLELGVGVTEKGGQGEYSSPGLALCVADQILAWQGHVSTCVLQALT